MKATPTAPVDGRRQDPGPGVHLAFDAGASPGQLFQLSGRLLGRRFTTGFRASRRRSRSPCGSDD